MDEKCKICNKPVRVMCQKGTGVCSQRCAKKRAEVRFAFAA